MAHHESGHSHSSQRRPPRSVPCGTQNQSRWWHLPLPLHPQPRTQPRVNSSGAASAACPGPELLPVFLAHGPPLNLFYVSASHHRPAIPRRLSGTTSVDWTQPGIEEGLWPAFPQKGNRVSRPATGTKIRRGSRLKRRRHGGRRAPSPRTAQVAADFSLLAARSTWPCSACSDLLEHQGPRWVTAPG